MSEHRAVQNLRENQQQLDMDGIMVGVSRQSVEETLSHIAELEQTIAAQREAIDAAELALKFALCHVELYGAREGIKKALCKLAGGKDE